MDPFILFQEWYSQELNLSHSEIPTACCLSTIGIDGFPNARFVSLKEILNGRFIVTGSLSSRKGKEIIANNKVALSFWWPNTLKQVRIQGIAGLISHKKANYYFQSRDYYSKLVSSISKQGKANESIHELKNLFEIRKNEKLEIKCPNDWGGFSIKTQRIEFMKFNKTRFHERVLYTNISNKWKVEHIEP